MKKKVSPLDFIIYMSILTGVIFCIVDSTFRFVSIGYNRYIVLGIICASLIYVYLITSFKYVWTSLFLIFLIPKPLYTVKYLYAFALKGREVIKSIIENYYIDEKYTGYFILLVYILIPIFAAIIYYIAAVRKHTAAIIIPGSAMYMTYYYFDTGSYFSSCNLFIILCLGLYAFNEQIREKINWKNLKADVKSNFFFRKFIWIVILLFLTNVVVKIFPYNAKPASLDWLQESVFSSFEGSGGSESLKTSKSILKNRFNFSYTGFQQNPSMLGGPVKLNNSIAMRIYSGTSEKDLHLRGTVKDNYNGYIWTKTNTDSKKYNGTFSIGEAKGNFSDKKIDIYPVKTITSTVFNVLYPSKVENRWGYVFVDSDGEVLNPKSVKQGQKYSVLYREYDFSKLTLLDSAKYPGIYSDELQKYLNLPSTLPYRVVKLTRDITQKYSSPYERASAVENYLKENYPYDRNVSYLPQGRDFVDYFLFDEKKGYCTYYASAMAVMCRIANIPSRYVEGYDVTSTGGVSGYRDVLNSSAHAWVELYFEGIGWVTFDPTPGHASSAQKKSNMEKTAISNIEENYSESVTNENATQNRNSMNEKDFYNDSGTSTENSTNKHIIYLLIGAGILSATFIYYALKRKRYGKDKDYIMNISRDMMHYGKYAGVPYNSGETFREYFKRLGNRFDIDMGEYTEIYEKTLYGNYVLQEKDYMGLNEVTRDIRSRARVIKGTVMFYLLDYIHMYPAGKINKIFKKSK